MEITVDVSRRQTTTDAVCIHYKMPCGDDLMKLIVYFFYCVANALSYSWIVNDIHIFLFLPLLLKMCFKWI